MAMFPARWPLALQQAVSDIVGPFIRIEPLAGLSGAAVWRVASPDAWAIVKRSTTREAQFYQSIAPQLRAVALGVPELLWCADDFDASWLVLEYIPAAPLRSNWLANPEWMRTLAGLHEQPPALIGSIADPFCPNWTPSTTEAALNSVAAEERPELRDHLNAIMHAVQSLSARAEPISGDPNPLNWGLRADGQAVLFDWERVGLGPLAFDLAITIPGLAQQVDAQLVAQAYLTAAEAPDRSPTSVQTLTQDILRCKVWVVVEFMATVVERNLSLPSAYQALFRAVPAWVAQLASDHGSRIRHNCPEEPQRPSNCW